MQEIKLNQKENDIAKKTGFYVRQTLWPNDYFTTLFSHIAFYNILIFIVFFVLAIILSWLNSWFSIQLPDIIVDSIFFLIKICFLIGTPILWWVITWKYFLFRNVMVTANGILTNNFIYKSIEDIPLSVVTRSIEINNFWWQFLKDMTIPNIARSGKWLKINSGEVIIYMLTWLFSGTFFLIARIYFFLGVIVIYLLTIFNNFGHFLSLWFEIQEITKKMILASDTIKLNFVGNQKFWELEEWLDTFALILKKLTTKIIRIEKIERSIGKWNIFDSQKYLNSLKGNITEPLRLLQSFLGNKRTELIASREELSRVRVQVGWASENRDLQSARTEPLMVELTENIDQLDVMIKKMG